MGDFKSLRRRVSSADDRMERVTLRMPEEQIEGVEQQVEENGEFENRSEAIQGALADLLADRREPVTAD